MECAQADWNLNMPDNDYQLPLFAVATLVQWTACEYSLKVLANSLPTH